jgi:hypothetical protein
MINKEIAQAILVFLDRSHITPREIDAFIAVVKELRSIIEASETSPEDSSDQEATIEK